MDKILTFPTPTTGCMLTSSGFFFTNLRYILQIPRKRSILFPTSSTSTGSSTPSCLFFRLIDLNLGVKNQVSYELCKSPPLIRGEGGPHRVLFVHHYFFHPEHKIRFRLQYHGTFVFCGSEHFCTWWSPSFMSVNCRYDIICQQK